MTVEGQSPNTNNANADGNTASASTTQSGGASEANGGTPDVKRLIEEAVAAATAPLQERIHKLNEENKARREKAEAEANEKRKALEEQGEFKALVDQLKQDIAARDAKVQELEALRPLADRYKSWEAKQLDAIKEREANLPEHFKKLLAGQRDVDGKLDVLAAYDATVSAAQGKQPEHKPPTDGPPAGTDSTSSPWDKLKRGGGGGFSAQLRASAVRAKE